MNQYKLLKNISDLSLDKFAIMFSNVIDESLTRNQIANFTRGNVRPIQDGHLKAIQNCIENDTVPEFTEMLRNVYGAIDTMFKRQAGDDNRAIIVNQDDMGEIEDDFSDLDDALSLDDEMDALYNDEDDSEVNDSLSDDELDDVFGDNVTKSAEIKEVPPIDEAGPWDNIGNEEPSDEPLYDSEFDNVVDTESSDDFGNVDFDDLDDLDI